jgi:hypothetical protein
MALSPYALTTLAAAKEQLGIPTGNTSFDALVTRFINEATGKIETFCDRKLKQRTGIVEYQDGFANNRLLLDQWPAQKPTELWIDNSGLFTDTAKKLDTSEYALDLSARGEGIGVVLPSKCFFPRGTRNIKVVYDAGFITIPDELEGACLWTVSFLYDMRDSKSIGVETRGKNQENINYREDLPKYVQDTLLAYKRAEWPTGDRMLSTR